LYVLWEFLRQIFRCFIYTTKGILNIMDKRWNIFLIITALVTLVFFMDIKKEAELKQKQQKILKKQEQLSSGDVVDEYSSEKDSDSDEYTDNQDEIQKSDDSSEKENDFAEESDKEEFISVITDIYEIELTNRGGRPSRWGLFHSVAATDKNQSTSEVISLIQDLGGEYDRELPLEINFREYNSTHSYSALNRMLFDHEKTEHPNGDIEVLFTSPEIDGIYITKQYIFHPDSHLSDFLVTIHNTTESDIRLNNDGKGLGVSWGPGFGKQINVKDSYEKRLSRTFYSLTDGKTVGFKLSASKTNEASGEIKWAGLNTRFMLTAIIPVDEKGVFFNSVVRPRNLKDAEGVKRDFSILPGTITLWLNKAELPAEESRSFSYKIFIGPRKYSLLKESGHDLLDAMFFTHWGWMQWLCTMLLFVLHWLQGIVHNYGIAIICLTILVRVCAYPLTHKGMKLQAKAMAEQAKIRPYIDELNKKYADNPQLKNKKLMELYKEHGINPLGFLRGCLPMMIQMPIFISLYFLLSESFELRGATFLWITDLSSPDRLFAFGSTLPVLGEYFNLLPILMGVSQLLVSKFTSTASADPNQKNIMYLMPIMFIFILYNMSSGLILYWLVSNLLQAGQQFIINRHMKKEKAAA
jgi:YidC/Oxa1 family membrane protein insertase